MGKGTRWAWLFGCLCWATSCGGGGGGTEPDPDPVPALLAVLSADLRGDLQPSSPSPEGRAALVMRVFDDGSLEFAAAGQTAWAGDVAVLGLRQGTSGQQGTHVVDLLAGNGGFAPPAWVAQGASSVAASTAIDLATNPATFHVRIDRASDGAPLMRGQTVWAADADRHVLLAGGALVPAGSADAHGAATIRIAPTGAADVLLGMGSPGIGTVTKVGLYEGVAGANGALLREGFLGAATSPDLRTASLSLSLAEVARLRLDPAAFHAVVSEGGTPVARGQVADGAPALWAALSVDGSVAAVGTRERAGVTIEFASFTSADVVIAASPVLGIEQLSSAGIRQGEGLTSDPVVLDLAAVLGFQDVEADSAQATVVTTRDATTRLLAAPEAFSARVGFPVGGAGADAARGALTRVPIRFFGALPGGALDVTAQNPSAAEFRLVMGDPVAADVVGAAIYDGPPESGGATVADLTANLDAPIGGSLMQGSVALPEGTLARMLAAPEQFTSDVQAGAPAESVAQATLDPGLACAEDGYIPPIEGVWQGTVDGRDVPVMNWNWQWVGSQPIPPPCAPLTATISFPEGDYAVEGSYEDGAIEFTMEATGADTSLDGKSFTGTIGFGTIDATATDDPGVTVALTANEFRPVFGGTWIDVADPNHVLLFTSPADYAAISGGAYEDVQGVLVEDGVQRAFAGTFSGNSLALSYLDDASLTSAVFDHAGRIVWQGGAVFRRAGP